MTRCPLPRAAGIAGFAAWILLLVGALLGVAVVAFWMVAARTESGDSQGGSGNPLERFGDLPPVPQASLELRGFGDDGFALQPDELVVFLGGTNTVRLGVHGHLEAALTRALADRGPRFRQMGWEGDSVHRQLRSPEFGTVGEQLAWVGAGAVIAQFGKTELVDDPLDQLGFLEAYGRMLDAIGQHTRRIVLLSPTPFEAPPGPGVPDLVGRNAELERRVDAIGALAQARGFLFVDVFRPLLRAVAERDGARLTDDGVHLTEHGLEQVTREVAGALLPGAVPADAPPVELVAEVALKNHLWQACWRPDNWPFVYGELTKVAYHRGSRGTPSLEQELKLYKPRIAAADVRIHQVAQGDSRAPRPPVPPLPEAPPVAPDRDAELAQFEVAKGFSIDLFASEEHGVVQPVDMVWDERGRLWIACCPSYPQIAPGQKANDYILVCEDRDGDHRIDASFVFAEGLHMPLGLELGGGGLYVCESSRLLHLRDTDGDGRADAREVLFEGFGTGDSHETISTPGWGPMGSLYFGQGNNIFSRVETVHGTQEMAGGGVWRYRPRQRQLDPFVGRESVGLNPRTVTFTPAGQPFSADSGSGRGYWLQPGLVRGVPPQPLPRFLFDPRSKGTGVCFVESSHFPDDMQGKVVIGGFIANALELNSIHDDGSGFGTRSLPHLVQSKRSAFRIVDVHMGPDGALYALDFHSPVITHYKAPYRDPGRDRTHGRVWRVTTAGRPLVTPPDLTALDASGLVALLGAREQWTRYQARRLLFDRPTEDVTKAIDAWLARALLGGTDAADALSLREVAGVLAAHEVARPALVRYLLGQEDHPALRAWAARLVGRWHDRLEEPAVLLQQAVADAEPRVRLEAVVAATEMRGPGAVDIVLRALRAPGDVELNHAINLAIVALETAWRADLDREEPWLDWQPVEVARFLSQAQQRGLPARVQSWLADAGPARDVLLEGVLRRGDVRYLGLVLGDPGVPAVAVLEAVADAAEQQGMRPGKRFGKLVHVPDGALARWLEAGDEPRAQVAAARLVRTWAVASLLPRVAELAADVAAAVEVRAACVTTLGALRRETAQAELARLAGGFREPPAVVRAAIRSLLAFDARAAALHAAPRIAASEDDAEIDVLITAFATRDGGAEALANALRATELSSAQKTRCATAMGRLGLQNRALLGLFHEMSPELVGLPAHSDGLVERLAALAEKSGDPRRGREVYAAKLVTCAACHAIDGVGGRQGPDLSRLGNNMAATGIVEAVLWPSREIKAGYETMSATTTDGETFTGQKRRETKQFIELYDSGRDRSQRIYKRNISRTSEQRSIMPQGLAASLAEQEFVDVVAYLASLGRDAEPR